MSQDKIDDLEGLKVDGYENERSWNSAVLKLDGRETGQSLKL